MKERLVADTFGIGTEEDNAGFHLRQYSASMVDSMTLQMVGEGERVACNLLPCNLQSVPKKWFPHSVPTL